MPFNVRRAGAVAATVMCVMTPAAAQAQSGGSFGNLPGLTSKPPTKLGGGKTTPTPTPTATPTPKPTRTPKPAKTATPAPTATPTATAKPGKGSGDLPETGTDALAVALGGLSLMGFGLSLRMRLALDDADDDRLAG